MFGFKKNPESRLARALQLLKRIRKQKPKFYVEEPRIPVGSIDMDDEYEDHSTTEKTKSAQGGKT